MAGKQKFKIGINNIVSWGATVVIVGLLFKINHYPHAETFIAIGLGAEALLFFILGFQSEPTEIDWTRVYPELAEEPKPKVVVDTTKGASPASLEKMMADAKITPELVGSLGAGLKTFSDKVSTISKVADAGAATQEFTTKLKTAGASYDTLNAAFAKASSNLTDFAATGADTKTYQEQVSKLSKNLSALNTVYELELQGSTAHVKSMDKYYQSLDLTMKSFTESATDSQKFKEEVGRLAKNLASLNSVYGNMLSAMNQPKA